MERGLIYLACAWGRSGIVADFLGVREGTWVIASPPNPLSKYGEGAYLLGAGEDKGGEYIPIELLQTGYLVFTHRNRYMPVLQVFKLNMKMKCLKSDSRV
jgi:hypothetical protein